MKREIAEALVEFGDGELTLHEDYNGRGCLRTCHAVSGDMSAFLDAVCGIYEDRQEKAIQLVLDGNAASQEMADLESEGKVLRNSIRTVSMDNLGRDTIFY